MSTEHVQPTKVIQTLHACAEACIDGERGYLAASKDARDPALKALLGKYATERAAFISSLEHLIESLGAAPVMRGSVKAAAHRGFLNARVSMEGATDAVILGECERGELAALAVYERAVGEAPQASLPSDIRDVVVGQRAAIQAAYDDITNQDISRRSLSRPNH